MTEYNDEKLTKVLKRKAGLKCPYCNTDGTISFTNRTIWIGTDISNEIPNGHFPVFLASCSKCGHIDLFDPNIINID